MLLLLFFIIQWYKRGAAYYEVPFTLVLPAFTEVSSGKVKGEGKNGAATFPFTSAF